VLGVVFIMVGYPAKISCFEDAIRCRGVGGRNESNGGPDLGFPGKRPAVSGVHVGISVRRASGGATDHDSLNDG